jgi:DNA-binding IclR family transcriptional regulator
MTNVDEGGRPVRPEDFVQSVGRALRVLEVVGATPGLPVKTIARRCDLNISTTYHLVRTLAYEGYVERRSDGTYVPTVAATRWDGPASR